MESGNAAVGLVYLMIIGALYFLPWFVAMARNHHQRSAILILNLFLGWTGLGWIGALVWSATATRVNVTNA